MTTAVYRLPMSATVSRDSLVCHLSSISSQDAIERLSRAGVLAIEGPEENSILLLGFHREIRKLLAFWRNPRLYTDDISLTIAKLRRLSA